MERFGSKRLHADVANALARLQAAAERARGAEPGKP
jgi:hypothetical protein